MKGVCIEKKYILTVTSFDMSGLICSSHLRNWSILVKVIVHRDVHLAFFFSIYHVYFENVMKNSVSAWTPEDRYAWYTG